MDGLAIGGGVESPRAAGVVSPSAPTARATCRWPPRGRLPRLKARQLVQCLGHEELEAVKLLVEILHSGGDLCFKLCRLLPGRGPWPQRPIVQNSNSNLPSTLATYKTRYRGLQGRNTPSPLNSSLSPSWSHWKPATNVMYLLPRRQRGRQS